MSARSIAPLLMAYSEELFYSTIEILLRLYLALANVSHVSLSGSPSFDVYICHLEMSALFYRRTMKWWK